MFFSTLALRRWLYFFSSPAVATDHYSYTLWIMRTDVKTVTQTPAKYYL